MYTPEGLISFLIFMSVAVALIWTIGWAIGRKFRK